MTPAVIAIIVVFGALLLGRLAGARRGALMRRWPSLVLGLGAGIVLMRGQLWIALGLAAAAAIVWLLTPQLRPAPARVDPGDAEARRILGVGPSASAAEIRAAYRAKMAVAHPDRGGAHADAARLTAARDRLLKG